MFNKIPLVHFYLKTILLSLVIFSLFRFGYWLNFDDINNPIPTNELLTAFYLGLKFDLRLILFILMPVFLFGWIKAFNPVASSKARFLWLGYFTLTFTVSVFYYIADFIHYSYLHKPLDASVLRFVEDFAISFNMVMESYPVVWLLLGLATVSILYNYILRRISQPIFHQSHSNTQYNKYFYKRKWWQQTLFVTSCIFLYLFGLFGKFSYYPLRWSDAFASTHPFAPAVTVNPVVHFFDTLKNKSISFDLAKTQFYYNDIARLLQVKNKTSPASTTNTASPLNFKRTIKATGPLAAQQPNVVLVYLESFASYKTGVFGNKLNPTPHFDNIANNGLFFKRLYTPHTGTARSVFAGITGIPDIELNKTSTRNPLIVDQHTLVNSFKGYKQHYFLGGSANWGNIRGLLSHNIKDLTLHEEGDYTAERIDVWGISDLDLFIEANEVLKKENAPFFSIIQTSGNHRPYTIPGNNKNFKYVEQNKDDLTRNGFISEKEYNSFRFMDHSIGHFMALAKKEKYFDNTVFVFFGDHGISGFGGEHTARFESDFDLTGLHVPFVIYAPKLLAAKKYNMVASEVDILPTLASLMTNAYTNTTMGRDLLNPAFNNERYAFTITHENNPNLGLVTTDYIYKILADGSNGRLYTTDHSQFPKSNGSRKRIKDKDISKLHPELAEKLRRLTLGIYETAKYMRYHNKPINE